MDKREYIQDAIDKLFKTWLCRRNGVRRARFSVIRLSGFRCFSRALCEVFCLPRRCSIIPAPHHGPVRKNCEQNGPQIIRFCSGSCYSHCRRSHDLKYRWTSLLLCIWYDYACSDRARISACGILISRDNCVGHIRDIFSSHNHDGAHRRHAIVLYVKFFHVLDHFDRSGLSLYVHAEHQEATGD